jgi:hypothetical protein
VAGRLGFLLEPLRANVSAWATSAEGQAAMKWLEARLLLLSYEINRPYETWYGRKEALALPQEVERVLLEDAELGRDAAAYLKSARRIGAWDFIRNENAEVERLRRLAELLDDDRGRSHV